MCVLTFDQLASVAWLDVAYGLWLGKMAWAYLLGDTVVNVPLTGRLLRIVCVCESSAAN